MVFSCSTSSLGLDWRGTGQRGRVSRSHCIIWGSWGPFWVGVAIVVDIWKKNVKKRIITNKIVIGKVIPLLTERTRDVCFEVREGAVRF